LLSGYWMFSCGIVREQEADGQELGVAGGIDQGTRSSRARKSRKQREGIAERPRSEATHSGCDAALGGRR
jgi:hypothetical protein